MTTQKTYVGDAGTAIVLDCGQDISAATARSIEARKPDGTTASWPAYASGTTAIRFDTLAGTLDQAGRWRLQAKVAMPSGEWRGETVELAVYAEFG
jgi:hypothetical protein